MVVRRCGKVDCRVAVDIRVAPGAGAPGKKRTAAKLKVVSMHCMHSMHFGTGVLKIIYLYLL